MSCYPKSSSLWLIWKAKSGRHMGEQRNCFKCDIKWVMLSNPDNLIYLSNWTMYFIQEAIKKTLHLPKIHRDQCKTEFKRKWCAQKTAWAPGLPKKSLQVIQPWIIRYNQEVKTKKKLKLKPAINRTYKTCMAPCLMLGKASWKLPLIFLDVFPNASRYEAEAGIVLFSSVHAWKAERYKKVWD